MKVELYKRANKTSRWISFKTIDIHKSSRFIDDALNGQKSMIYTIRLIDEKDNPSLFPVKPIFVNKFVTKIILSYRDRRIK